MHTWACNPETISPGQGCLNGQGTAYHYDANNNLISKTDNRGVTTNYSYDALNRLISKTYVNDPSGTASSCYQSPMVVHSAVSPSMKSSSSSGVMLGKWQ